MSEGVAREAIIVDPGFGFGKTPAHNAAMLRRLGELNALERPILAGVSGKSFAPTTFATGDVEVGGASLSMTAAAILAGADVLRVHDVQGTVQLIRSGISLSSSKTLE